MVSKNLSVCLSVCLLPNLTPIISGLAERINESERNTRSVTAGKLIEKGKTELLQATYINDGSKLWNISPNEVTKSLSLWSAKKAIKTFVKTLPI